MSQSDQYTPLRHALADNWQAADRATYELLFKIMHRSHCKYFPLDAKAWNHVRSQFWEQVRNGEFLTDKDTREFISLNNLQIAPGIPGENYLLSIWLSVNQHQSALWEMIPENFKYWHQWPHSRLISSDELRKLDDLWLKRSKGKFGISVQREIFLACGGEIVVGEDPRLHIGSMDLQKFQRKVGWKLIPFTGMPPHFNYQDAPRGHLPMLSLHNPLLLRPTNPVFKYSDSSRYLDFSSGYPNDNPYQISGYHDPFFDYQLDGDFQTPICQHYCWWALAHEAFN